MYLKQQQLQAVPVLYNLTNLRPVSLSTAGSLSGIHSGQQVTLSRCALDDVQSQLNIYTLTKLHTCPDVTTRVSQNLVSFTS
jgi:hypothetical protein